MPTELDLTTTPEKPTGLDLTTSAEQAVGVAAAADGNPDAAAKANQLGRALEIPPAMVETDPEGFQKQLQQKQNADVINANEHVSDYILRNPQAAKVSQDDLPQLDNFTKARHVGPGAVLANAVDDVIEKLGEGFSGGYDYQEYARAAGLYQAGLGDDTALKAYEAQLHDQRELHGADFVAHSVGELAGMLASSAKIGAEAGVVTGAVGGAVGATAGGVGAVPGAVAGFGWGFTRGMATDFIAGVSGTIYRNADLAQAPTGEKIPEWAKQVGAVAGAAIVAPLMSLGPAASKVAGTLVSEAIVKMLGEKIVQTSLARGMGTVAKAGLTGGILNSGITLAQTLGQDAAKIFSGANFDTLLNSPKEWKELVSNLAHSFTTGALLFSTVAAPFVGVSRVVDGIRTKQAKSEAEGMDAAFDAAQESKTRERDPPSFEDFAKFDKKDVNIPGEVVAALREKDPAAFDFVPDIDKQVTEAATHGGDISIPSSKYFAYATPELHEAVREHIRGESGLNLTDVENLKDLEYKDEVQEGLFDQMDFAKARLMEPEAAEGKPARAPEVEAMFEESSGKIKAERKALWLDPIIVPDAAGVSKADFARYSKHIQELQRNLTDGAYRAAEREYKKQQTAEWRENTKTIAGQVESELRRRPDIMADQYLRTGQTPEGKLFKVKLDPDEVKLLLGDNKADLPKHIVGKKDAISADAMAELFGFKTGYDLVQALTDLEHERRQTGETPGNQLTRMIKTETTRRMELTYGKLDENIMRSAMGEAMDVAQVNVMLDELKAISPEEQLTREGVEGKVKDDFASFPTKKARDVRSFERLVAKSGLDAERSLLKERPNEAFVHKQNQLVNFLMLKEARQFVRDTNKLAKELDRLGDNRFIGSLQQDYVDQLHGLMMRLDIKVPRTPENLSEALKGVSLEKFIEEKQDEGKVIAAADFLTGSNLFGEKPMSQFTADEMRLLKMTVDSMVYNAREDKKVTVGESKVEFSELLGQAKENFERLGQIKLSAQPFIRGLNETTRAVDATLLKMEQLFDWVDHNDPNGPMNRAVFRPLKEAQHLKEDLLRDATNKISSIKTPKGWFKQLGKLTANGELAIEGKLAQLTRENMLGIMLNLGNKSNSRVLHEGYGWSPEAVKTYINRNATAADWKFVQGVWDTFEHFWPKVQEVTKRMSGVAVEKVPTKPIETPHGTFKGGYFPLIRDEYLSPVKVTKDSFHNQYYDPFVATGSFKARTGATYPLSLEINSIPWKLRQLVHGVAFREPVANALKVISDRTIIKGIGESFGPEYSKQLNPWLKYIATDGGSPDMVGKTWMKNLSETARQNAVVVLVGLRPSTALIHGGAALANSINEVGLRDLVGATADLMYRNPETMQRHWDWAMDASPELRNRSRNLDRDITNAMDKKMGQWKPFKAAAALWYMQLVSKLDLASAVPTFIAAYKQEVTRGLSHEDAVYSAEKRVRQAHGSSGIVDLSAIQRGNWAEKWFTMFFGYFNHNYNRLRDTGRIAEKGMEQLSNREIKAAVGSFGQVLNRSFWYLMAPALVHELVRPHGDPDESWGSFATRAIGLQLAGTMPYLRDAAHAYLYGMKPSVSPMGESLQGVFQPLVDIGKSMKDDGELSDNFLQHSLEAAGWVTGLQTKTTAGWGQFIWDSANGRAPPDTDYWRLLLEGNPNPKKH